jgi:hypothetical protein
MSTIGLGPTNLASSPLPAAEGVSSPAMSVVAMAARRRSFRVLVLCAMILLISIADLQITLMFLTSGGMAEGNPIARYIMSFDCQWLLGAWKLLLTGLACGTFICFRTRLSVELATWLCAAVMVWLAIRWGFYADYAALAAEHSIHVVSVQPHDWVSITDR